MPRSPTRGRSLSIRPSHSRTPTAPRLAPRRRSPPWDATYRTSPGTSPSSPAWPEAPPSAIPVAGTAKPPTRVAGGRWYSPYDGRYVDGPRRLDTDHYVPLAESWDSGASAWTPTEREAYANDHADTVTPRPMSGPRRRMRSAWPARRSAHGPGPVHRRRSGESFSAFLTRASRRVAYPANCHTVGMTRQQRSGGESGFPSGCPSGLRLRRPSPCTRRTDDHHAGTTR